MKPIVLRSAILVAIAAILGISWTSYAYLSFTKRPLTLPEHEILYTITPGATLAGVANDFKQKGYLDDPLFLRILGRLGGQAASIKAGEYRISAGITPGQLLDLFVAGKVTQYSFTIIEGWTFEQLIAEISVHPVLEHTLEGATTDEIMSRLGHQGVHPEGRFLPDTYHFPKGTTDISFLQRAFQALETKLASEWDNRAPNLPFETPYEALTLASIVEKETGLADERAQIAGVFARRLEKGMKLQTDPTVIYGMGERFDGNIRRRDLREETPYNTYVHKGLTPTPICMPGADAIHAALHPEEGDSLYFVAKGDGSHYFSATLVEHNDAVRKYQLKR